MGASKRFYTLEQMRKDDLLEDARIAEVTVELIRHSAKAILVYAKIVLIKVTPWLPKSQIIEPDPIALNIAKGGDELTLVVPLWLAQKNNLNYKEIQNECNTIR